MSPVEELWPLIQTVGRHTARKYPGVDADDLVMDLAEFAVKACSPTRTHPLNPDNEPGCKYILYRAAAILAAQSRAEALAGTSQYDYRPDDIREILPTALDSPENWEDAPVPEDARSLKAAADSLDVVLDVRAGLEAISYGERQAIINWHTIGPSLRGTALARAYYRAVESLAVAASTFRGGREERISVAGHPGSRRVKSNAQSKFEIDNQTGGA